MDAFGLPTGAWGISMKVSAQTYIVLAVLAILVVPSGGCGGSSEMSGGLEASFTAEEPAPGPSSVSLGQAGSSGDRVEVRVQVTDVSGLFGAAFYLTFDPAMATFDGHEPGEILESDGHTPFYLVEEGQPGVIVVSATRLGPVPAVDVTGSRTLMSLRFRVIDVGASGAVFQAGALYGSQLQPEPMPGVSWFGGQIVGR